MVKTTDKLLNGFLQKVRQKYRIDRAILFGSRARGDFKKDSDYDIILVSPDFKGKFFTDRMAGVYKYWNSLVNVDILCYTPQEISKMGKQIGIVSQALKEGVVL